MAHIVRLRMLLMSALGPAFAIFILVLFASYAVLGPSGILAWGDYDRQLEARKVELARLNMERARLQNRVDLLNPAHADPDLVDEMLRKNLNVGHPDDVIVPLN